MRIYGQANSKAQNQGVRSRREYPKNFRKSVALRLLMQEPGRKDEPKLVKLHVRE
ncbi:hypothetical protein OESDEN_14138 [Oesophagostomum dentatum]|uniref:Uncharacterized protein n=1 Tax=Oesophagostomum dentatum TaxID=61180 RepID=A0A0B1SSF9_OESDE|nr:hypothetical protein OESDEN_14138 [Oesophagostomum dentatum]